MSLTTVQTIVEYNNFPDELEKTLKPFDTEKGATFKMLPHMYSQVLVQKGFVNGQEAKYGASRSEQMIGTKTIQNRWTISYKSKVIECGFQNGINEKGATFAKPAFFNGTLTLLPGDPNSEFYYKLMQLHPRNDSSKFKGQSTWFAEVFPEQDEKEEAAKLVKRSGLITEISSLSDSDKKYVLQISQMPSLPQLFMKINASESGYELAKKAIDGVFEAKLKDALEYALKQNVVSIDIEGLVKLGKAPVGISLKDVAESQRTSQLLYLLAKPEHKKAANDIIKGAEDFKSDEKAKEKSKS
jgi:hypothetical protein